MPLTSVMTMTNNCDMFPSRNPSFASIDCDSVVDEGFSPDYDAGNAWALFETEEASLLKPLTMYATFIVVLCLLLLSSFVFMEFIAYLTKKAVHHMAGFLALSYDNDADFSSLGAPHCTPSHMLAHQLIDKTCPVYSHTPSELPCALETEKPRYIPAKLRSPCGLCDMGIALGELCRILPCGHRFHARCVDKACLTLVHQNTYVKQCVACPTCQFVVYPTPELIRDTFIFIQLEN